MTQDELKLALASSLYLRATPPEQEPVATLLLQSKQNYERNFGPSAAADWIYSDLLELLNTNPPQRKPLTDEAIYAMCDDFHNWSEWDGGEYQRLWLNLCRAIEAAHGIKENT